MSGGFSNPIVGGGGDLVYPSIQSPNFNIANPPLSPSPSWAILKTGIAYFFGLALAGGTITGPDYVINTSGIFIYSGTPATGNLIGSWAGASGTDAFGNLYPAGFNITTGAISGTTFSGADFIINSSGIFIYSGPPAGPGGGSLAEVPVTPEVITASGGVAASTQAFSPAAGSMAVVPVSWLFASNIGATLTCKDSLGNAYTPGPQVQDVNQVGISALFTHVYPVAPGPVTVTVTCTDHGGARAVVAPRVLAGQAASQAGAATVAAPGAASPNVQKAITTTTAGSLVYLAADTSAVAVLTAIASTATILADGDALVGDTGATGRTAAATVTPGATVIGWTSNKNSSFGFAALEVLPASGAGNLIGSWAGQAGTDAFGNPYPQGLNVSIGTIAGTAITGSSFSGTDFVLNTSGLFLYSAAPALGNLIVSVAQAAGTDAFGNLYKAGVWAYGNNASAVGLVPSGNNTALALSGGNPSVTPAAIANTVVAYGAGSGTMQIVDSQDGATYGTARRTLVLGSTSGGVTSATPVTIFTNAITPALAANKSYRVHGQLYVTASGTTSQFGMEFAGPGSLAGQFGFTISRATTFVAQVSGGPNSLVGAAVNLGTATYTVFFDGVFVVSTAGSLLMQVFNVSALSSFTVNIYSFLDLMPV